MERHDTDPVALFFGLIFLVAGSLFFLGAEVGAMSPDWVLPSVLVGVGLTVAAATLSLASRKPVRAGTPGDVVTVPEDVTQTGDAGELEDGRADRL